MGLEIERKFLVDRVPADLAIDSEDEIAQGYLSVGEDQVRLRRRGDRHVLTVKRGAGLEREEVEVPLAEGVVRGAVAAHRGQAAREDAPHDGRRGRDDRDRHLPRAARRARHRRDRVRRRGRRPRVRAAALVRPRADRRRALLERAAGNRRDCLQERGRIGSWLRQPHPRRPLLDDELEQMFTLIGGADSVELKLTVPESDQRSTVVALGMDPLDAELRQVYFFDTPDLALNKKGVVVRARRVQRKGGDSVVKLRPVVPSELPDEMRRITEPRRRGRRDARRLRVLGFAEGARSTTPT